MEFEIKNGILRRYRGSDRTVTVPDGVTEIGELAFEDCQELEELILPDSVNVIGESAFFMCTHLQRIQLPGSMTTIGRQAFQLCERLTSLEIPEGVTELAADMFTHCARLTSVGLPRSLRRIGNHAFWNCKALRDIRLPECLTGIGYRAFFACGSLRELQIPETVTELGGQVLWETPWMEEQKKNSPLVVINGILHYAEHSKGAVTVPDGVTMIGDSAFSRCKELTAVHVPDSVTAIGEEAFTDCTALTDVNIPDGVTRIGKCAFYRCRSLESVTIPAGVTEIGEGAFSMTPWIQARQKENPLVTVNGILLNGFACEGAVTVPEGVTRIGDNAFCYNRAITSVVIPACVESIGHFAFTHCVSLTALHWVGRCNVTGIPADDKVSDKLDIGLAMVQSHDFGIKLDARFKFLFLLGMYRETEDADALAAIKKQFTKFMKLGIEAGDAEHIAYLLEHTALVTSRNIGRFIELAIEKQQHEIYVMLLNYKAEKLGYQDAAAQFRL